MNQVFENGQRVYVPGIGNGIIIRTRIDSNDRPIYTVYLDDDGIHYARPEGLCKVTGE